MVPERFGLCFSSPEASIFSVHLCSKSSSSISSTSTLEESLLDTPRQLWAYGWL